MGGGRNVCFLGRIDFAYFCGKTPYCPGFCQNRGAPKTAVPATTHPIPHLTPSEQMPTIGNKIMTNAPNRIAGTRAHMHTHTSYLTFPRFFSALLLQTKMLACIHLFCWNWNFWCITLKFASTVVSGIIFGNVTHVCDGGQRKITELRHFSCIKNYSWGFICITLFLHWKCIPNLKCKNSCWDGIHKQLSGIV